MDRFTEGWLRGRNAAAEERKPLTLQNNRKFFEQYAGAELESVRRLYNYFVQRVNWQGYNFVVRNGLPEAETREGLAQALTNFQTALGNLDEREMTKEMREQTEQGIVS